LRIPAAFVQRACGREWRELNGAAQVIRSMQPTQQMPGIGRQDPRRLRLGRASRARRFG
jgi:hypothetical protein